MRKTSWFMVLALAAGCGTVHVEDHLEGGCHVQGVSNDTIIVTQATNFPSLLRLCDSKGRHAERVTVKRGGTFILSDGWHVWATYRFRGASRGRVQFAETVTEDTESMGGEVRTRKRNVEVVLPTTDRQ